MTDTVISQFQKIIYGYYKNSGRNFPFREKISPYYVLISEIMLQQTQTSRVSQKFLEFIDKFPNFTELANANLDEVLQAWQGLGYNRRAVALKNIAEIVVNEYEGTLPQDVEALKTFPQIGHNTASSIVSFAYNKPTFFIETNIRRVYIYFFFPGRNDVDDKEIMRLLKQTADIKNPREWYYALMDYGVMLKKTHPELNKRSKHYRKQKKFKGSNRQLRGKILKLVLKSGKISFEDLKKEVNFETKKINKVVHQLEREGFLKKKDDYIMVSK
ncbi:MAG: A/G-specific adenine glycosylase [Candidatus Lokiarchaeota archaeon]|nr:A/G-specific adenine glycosylase [Candidatus Lokiarchaeota archaeon]MBD3201438.1 A/G-specific adenine glycosylase [Candidatus Lokiarchaeota archaeon]